MKYLSVLGRQPEISLAELSALFANAQKIAPNLATFESETEPNINRLGGSLKLAKKLDGSLTDYLFSLPEGKITIGFSDYSKKATARTAGQDAMKLKKILTRKGRSVRIVQNKSAVLSTATSHHNHLGSKEKAVEIIKVNKDIYISIGTQDITAYARRDQARPARDAKVGMLPPKLAQILINLCGPLPEKSRILDPFCGTGVLLQEAYLMGYTPYGTDIDARMVDYSQKNLEWLVEGRNNARREEGGSRGGVPRGAESRRLEHAGEENARQDPRSVTAGGATGARDGIFEPYRVEQGDATSHQWTPPIAAVACEAFLGQPMSQPPAEIKLKQEKQRCKEIISGFLKNLQGQIGQNTPVVIAIPAWLRPDGHYERINLDFLPQLEYNRTKESGFDDLLYYRDGQIVARNIIILRKK